MRCGNQLRAAPQRLWLQVVGFFVLAFAITGAGAWENHLAAHGNRPIPTWVPYAVGAGPSVAGLLMTLLLYGLPGIWRLAVRLNPWSVGRAWPMLVICLLLPLGVIVLPIGILAALGVASIPPPSWPGPGYLFGAVISGGLLGPGLFEEIGWRGFALPHLQRRYSALVSSLIIGFVWAFWHFPNFLLPADSPPWSHLIVFVPLLMALSVLFTWVYNSTGGNLFAVMLLHGATYSALGLCEASGAGVAEREDVIFLLLFAIVAVGLVWRFGVANLSRRERVVVD